MNTSEHTKPGYWTLQRLTDFDTCCIVLQTTGEHLRASLLTKWEEEGNTWAIETYTALYETFTAKGQVPMLTDRALERLSAPLETAPCAHSGVP